MEKVTLYSQVREFADKMAQLLSDNPAAFHDDFFYALAEQLKKRNVNLIAEQEGIAGTYIHLEYVGDNR